MALIGACAPVLGTLDPTAINPATRNRPPGFARTIRAEDGSTTTFRHRMGTDSLGRDVYSRVLDGARVSLLIAVPVAALSLAIGLFHGLVAGTIRPLDGPIMRLKDGLMAIPGILLAIALPGGGDRLRAVGGVSFTVAPGEIVCVAGESGSGKSVTAFSAMGLLARVLKPVAGAIRLLGEDVLTASPQRLRALGGDRMTMNFQEPMTALNPVLTVGDLIEEVLRIHTDVGVKERRAKVLAMLEAMHLPDPERMHASYPHQLSGGQRQRVMIAAALILDPALLIADEPTTALDVSVQRQVLALLDDVQRRFDLAILFITHDLRVAAQICDRLIVMQSGRIVEEGPTAEVFARPNAAYTRALIEAAPGRKFGRGDHVQAASA